MKTLLRRWTVAVSAAVAALFTTSCYYDGYYGGGGYAEAGYSVPANYSYGFGAGYGYGHPRFSTSFFVSTGDPRWGYDPYSYSYFDYHSHRYYDPYLHGYYPLGYRPSIVYGVPHVHGYRRGYAPPPRHIRNNIVVGYRDRAGAYRRSNYDWRDRVSTRSGQFQTRNSYGAVSRTGNRYDGRTSDRRIDSRTRYEDRRGYTGPTGGRQSAPSSRMIQESRNFRNQAIRSNYDAPRDARSRYNAPQTTRTRYEGRTTYDGRRAANFGGPQRASRQQQGPTGYRNAAPQPRYQEPRRQEGHRGNRSDDGDGRRSRRF